MDFRKNILFLIAFSLSLVSAAQVRIRVFTDRNPGQVFFYVDEGKYLVDAFNGTPIVAEKGEIILLAKSEGRFIVKTRKSAGFYADSVSFRGTTGDDLFSVGIQAPSPVRQYYSGDLECLPDFGTILMINTVNEEKYIEGVVKAEGGTGRSPEFTKTQAVIARTYMYRYKDKHLSDGYSLCDNTHCQAFNGISGDTSLNRTVAETRDLVILDRDSVPVISAFHSNCGGETSSAEDVWLAPVPYLKSVKDPYCSGSRNAAWLKSIPGTEWIALVRKHGYKDNPTELTAFRFIQNSRSSDYRTGTFTVPMRNLRDELGLRSAFFSVLPQGDSVVLKGKGYGHGVGLCQEGAMVMAAKGFSFRQIISFYYSGVIISDISNAAPVPVIGK